MAFASPENIQNCQITVLLNIHSIKAPYVIHAISAVILLHEKCLQFDWLRAVVFQLNLKYIHVKITNLLRVVV